MTTPVQHGHPDWGRTISAADIQVIRTTHVQVAAQDDLGTFFVGNLPYLWVRMSVNAGGAKLTLNWMDAPTGGNILTTNEVHTRVTITATGPFVILGPWVQLVTETDAIPRTITMTVWQSLDGGQDVTPGQGNILITQNLTNVVAGTTVNFNPVRARWGWGYWHAHLEVAVSFRILLLAVDYLNATTLLDFVPASVQQPGQLILLPPMPVRLNVFNNDGVDRGLLAIVAAHPGPLGGG